MVLFVARTFLLINKIRRQTGLLFFCKDKYIISYTVFLFFSELKQYKQAQLKKNFFYSQLYDLKFVQFV